MITSLRHTFHHASSTLAWRKTSLPNPGGNQRWNSIRTAAFSTATLPRLLQWRQTFSYHKGPIKTLAGDSTGNFLISGCGAGTIMVKELRSSEKPYLLKEGEKGNPVTYLSHLAKNRLLVGGMHYGTIKVWNMSGGEGELGTRIGPFMRAIQTIRSTWKSSEQLGLKTHLGAINGIIEIFSPLWNRPMIVSASQDWKIKVWDPQNPKKPLCEVGEHSGPVYCLTNCNGNTIGSSSEDGTVRIWEPLTTEEEKKELFTASFFKEQKERLLTLPFFKKQKGQLLKTLNHGGSVVDLLFFPARNTLLSRNSSNISSTIKAWDLSDLTKIDPQIKSFHASNGSLEIEKIRSWAALKDETVALGYENGKIRLWKPFDKSALPLHTLPQKHQGKVNQLTVLQDGSLVSGSEDGVIYWWVPESQDNPMTQNPR